MISRKPVILVCLMWLWTAADLKADSKYRKGRRSRVERSAHLRKSDPLTREGHGLGGLLG